jgi:hypothetical protein
MEFYAEISGFHSLTRNDSQMSVDPEALYRLWIPHIYIAAGSSPPGQGDEPQLRSLWFGATGRKIRDFLQGRGAAWVDEVDMLILTYYFEGGMLLRRLEAGLANAGEEATRASIFPTPAPATPPAQGPVTRGNGGCSVAVFAFALLSFAIGTFCIR